MCNFVPVQRENYCIGVPYRGVWAEVFSSDAKEFGGGGRNQRHRYQDPGCADARLRAEHFADAAGRLCVLPGVRKENPQEDPPRGGEEAGCQGGFHRPFQGEKDRGKDPLTGLVGKAACPFTDRPGMGRRFLTHRNED